jgi:DNA-binding winged helix-turn-helix (wHTH) protein/TolB-like protein/Tfp pilus assembly protein PilF
MRRARRESPSRRAREYTGPVVPTATGARILRFGAFELDLIHDELRRGGVLIKLAPQQLRVLRYLAEHTGEVVPRDEIQREIWGSEVFVDFDRSLNVCIAQIRAALNDDSEAARFIQTVPRRGYRFVAPVEQVTGATPTPPVPAPRRNLLWVGIAAAVLIASAILWSSKTAPPGRTVLAVLPFENVTGRSEDTPVIDGLADELNTQFGTALPQRLGVIGRTSVRRFAGQKTGVAQIGRELAAAYVVEGDLRSEGPRIRISARLVKVSDQAQVWSDSYEMENASRLEMEEETAARVTAGVIAALFPEVQRSRPDPHAPSREAYEAYVNGRYLQQKRTRSDIQRSLAFFEDAGRRDSAFAEPWAAMAEAYISLALSGSPDAAAILEQARQAATHALAVNETNAEAQNALGTVLLWRDWNAAEAERRFTRAIALNPSLAPARHDFALLLILTGHPELGVAELRRAIAIDPLSPRVNVDAGWLLLQAHRYDQAIVRAKRALELEPGLDEARACIARAEFHRGGATPAVLQFYQARLASSNPYERALAQAVAGHPAETVSALQEAYQKRSILMIMAGTEPAFAGLAGNPAYREIVRQVWAGGDQARAR